MSKFSNNQLHRSGWHVLASTWQMQSKEGPEPRIEKGIRNRKQSATVVWTTHNNTRNTTTTTTSIAFIGGYIPPTCTKSVIVLHDVLNGLSKSKWQNGPNLNECKGAMGASICNGYVYVVGGEKSFFNRPSFPFSDTIERIPLSQLFNYDPKHNKFASWKRLRARLSEPRWQCAAVTVNNRFIVVMGGSSRASGMLSSVDIIDTMTPSATTNCFSRFLNNDPHPTVVTVSAGPRLQIPRYWFTATVWDDRIWVVGGEYQDPSIPKAVECLSFRTNNNDDCSQSTIFSSAWILRPDLSLQDSRYTHGVAVMGQCLAVAGGLVMSGGIIVTWRDKVGEALLDPQRGVVMHLPDMVGEQRGTAMMKIPHQGLVTMRLDEHDGTVRINSLPCVNLSMSKIKRYLQELKCRQQSFIPCSVRHTLDGTQEGSNSEISPLTATVECLCHSLVFYYLFHQGGHVPCLQHHQDMKQVWGHEQSLPNKSNSKT